MYWSRWLMDLLTNYLDINPACFIKGPIVFYKCITDCLKPLVIYLIRQSISSCSLYHVIFWSLIFIVFIYTGWPEEVFKSSEKIRWHDPWPVKQRPLDLTAYGIWNHIRPLASPWEQLHSQVRKFKKMLKIKLFIVSSS